MNIKIPDLNKKIKARLAVILLFIIVFSSAFVLYNCGDATYDIEGGPCGIAVDTSNNVYATFPTSGIIKKYNSSGSVLLAWASRIPSWSKGSGPFGIAVNPNGTYVYTTDIANGIVQIYNSSGTFVSQYGAGSFFNNPEGIAVNSNAANNDVYITDYENNRVFIYLFVPNNTVEWNSAGSGNGQFEGPIGIAIDSSDNVYVCDYRNNRVQKFNSAGVYQTQWGSKGSGNGQFEGPMGIAVDSANSVAYVADTFNNRIQKFDLNGSYQLQWGIKGHGAGQFERPQGIAVDSAGNVYVADTQNLRIQKFDSGGLFITMWQ